MSTNLQKSTVPPIVLGLDYGEKRIGTALLTHSLPSPVGVIAHSDKTFDEIKQFCQDQQIELIVVGISEGKTEVATREFIEHLQKTVKIPVTTWDETLSTQEAQQRLGHLLNKFPLDALAASVMLEDWYECLPV